MSKLRHIGFIGKLGLDAAAWYFAPALFLYFYLRYPAAEPSAIAPHLLILTLAFLLVSAVRVSVALFLPSSNAARAAIVFSYALAFLLTLIYYPLVLIGLDAWGQVISWDLIRSYALQAPDLADALGISFSLSSLGIFAVFVGFLTIVWWYLKRLDWPQMLVTHVCTHGHIRALSVALVGLFAITGLSLSGIFIFPDRETTEPFVTTFFPNDGVRSFRGFGNDAKAGEKLDQENDAARAAYQPNPQADKKNLIIIVVDALRPDHLGLYGYKRETTPNLSRLAKSPDVNVRVVNGMRASCSESACGLFSLASSKYFHEISARPFTIQQALKAHGYDIRMILGGDHTNFYGLRKLYSEVDSFIDGSDPSAKYANADRWVIAKADELPSWSGTPTMIQFHLMSAHPLGQREKEFAKFLPATNYSLSITRATLKQENAVNYYDNGVLQTDDVINKLLQTLRTKKYLENSLVVITGDHGEALGEHGQYSHANGLREAVVLIPLVLLSYGHAPLKLSTARHSVSQVDISPTILKEFNMPKPVGWRGIPLQSDEKSETSYLQQGDEIGLIDLRFPPAIWKYWIKSRTGEEFAFNLTTDPNEITNVIPQHSKPLEEVVRDWRVKTRKIRPIAEGR
jgi:glucan phosphoethanolaminetransferase (alkaline phosphatase superfamily)